MFTVLAFVSYVIAAVIFFLLGIEEVTWRQAWGFFFIALGLALSCLDPAVVYVKARQQ